MWGEGGWEWSGTGKASSPHLTPHLPSVLDSCPDRSTPQGWWVWEVPGSSCSLPEAQGRLSPLKISDSPRPLTEPEARDRPRAPDSRAHYGRALPPNYGGKEGKREGNAQGRAVPPGVVGKVSEETQAPGGPYAVVAPLLPLPCPGG